MSTLRTTRWANRPIRTMAHRQRDTRYGAEQDKGASNPYQAPPPDMTSQQQQPRQRPPMSRAPPLVRTTPQNRPQPQPETDLYTDSPYATQSIIEDLLKSSLFAADDALLTRRILNHSAPFSAAAFSPQYRSGSGPSGGIPNVSRKSLLEFYVRFSACYTTLRGLCLELEALRSIWKHILECRESVARMYNLGTPVSVPVPTSEQRSGNGKPQPTKIKFQSNPLLIRNFLTVQASWTPSEVTSYFNSITRIEASFTRVENKLQYAIDTFFAFARGLGGGEVTPGPNETQAQAQAQAQQEWTIETHAGYDPDLLDAIERVVVEPVSREVRALEREFWFIGRKCPDWEIRGNGLLARRLGQVGMPGERWVIETAQGRLAVDIGYSRRDLNSSDDGVGGEFVVVNVGDEEMDEQPGLEVDWAAVDRMARMDAKQREKELEELEREIAADLEKEKELAEREWFREPGVNRHTMRKNGLPKTWSEKRKEMDKLLKQDVEFMYDDHDCVRGWLARSE